MKTRIKVDSLIAVWSNLNRKWKAKNRVFENDLNFYYKEHIPDTVGNDPFPAGTAVKLVKKQFKEMGYDLKVISMEKAPKFEEDVLY